MYFLRPSSPDRCALGSTYLGYANRGFRRAHGGLPLNEYDQNRRAFSGKQ
jgi:hypothetical protein